MRYYQREIEAQAKEAAKEFTINEEKRKAFIQGAVWTIEKLLRITDVHPMEEYGGATAVCDKRRLKEVNAFVEQMSAYRKCEAPSE